MAIIIPLLNKSNTLTGAVQVEANLQEQLVIIFTLENVIVAKTPGIESFHMFVLALTVSEILKFQIFYLEK